jgi:hypothetical protein
VAAVNVGTSAACRCLVREPRLDPAGRRWTYAWDEDRWVTGGFTAAPVWLRFAADMLGTRVVVAGEFRGQAAEFAVNPEVYVRRQGLPQT